MQRRLGTSADVHRRCPEDLTGESDLLACRMTRRVPPFPDGWGRDQVCVGRTLDEVGGLDSGDLFVCQRRRHGKNPTLERALHHFLLVLFEWFPIQGGAPCIGHDHLRRVGEGAADAADIQMLTSGRPIPIDTGWGKERAPRGSLRLLILPVLEQCLAYVDLGAWAPRSEEPQAADDGHDQDGGSAAQRPEPMVGGPVQCRHTVLLRRARKAPAATSGFTLARPTPTAPSGPRARPPRGRFASGEGDHRL